MKQYPRSLILDSGDDKPTLGRFPALDEVPGLSHGVTTRHGPDLTGDPAGENHRQGAALLAAELGIETPAWCRQVHGNRVLLATSGGLQGDADALVARVPGPGVLVRGADCTLVMAAACAPAGPTAERDKAVASQGVVGPMGAVMAVGAAHASWRGTVKGVTTRLIRKLVDVSGLPPERITAAISPSAGPCCYEVGDEVRREAVDGLGADVESCFSRRGERLFFDLWQANRQQLIQGGVPPHKIHLAGYCTICDNELFPSWRVEGTEAGRLAAVLGGRTDGDGGGSR